MNMECSTDILEAHDNSEILKFYNDSCVFVTGATGFVGHVLIEKLLRSCKIKKLYLLLRAKKGISPSERIESMFCDPLFERLKTEQENFVEKIAIIEGDVLQPNLGINELDLKKLLEDINVVFHVAATVRFDERLQTAVLTNIRATRDLMFLAKEMKNLKAFVHVSTAYSYCPNMEIDEKFYTVEQDPLDLIKVCENMDPDAIEVLSPKLLGKWPNTYSFTKALAEELIRTESGNLPVAIVRPSIIVGTAFEPIKSWVNNVFGPAGIVVGAGLGVLRTLHCDKDIISDIVPVDFVVNVTLSAAWRVDKSRICEPEDFSEKTNDVTIFNYVSSDENPIRWREFMKYNEKGMEVPSVYCIWYYFFTLNKYKLVHNIYEFLFHLIPAIFMDFGARLIGKKPMLWKVYKKLHRSSDVLAYFTLREWKFHTKNVKKLWVRMNPSDKLLFNFDIKSVNWEDNIGDAILGYRTYLANESMDTIPAGKKHYRRLKIAHYTLVAVFWFFFISFAWRVVTSTLF